MLQLEATYKRRRNWISIGYRAHAHIIGRSECTLPVAQFGFSLAKLRPEWFNYPPNIKGLRGRPIIAPSANSFPDAESHEELLLVSGMVIPAQQNSPEDDLDGNAPDHFVIRLLSKFEKFDTKREIWHRVDRHAKPDVYRFTPQFLGEIFQNTEGITISKLRIGLEKFKKGYFSAYFGMPPVVSKRFYLEITEHGFEILADEDQSDKANDVPLKEYLLSIETALQDSNLRINLLDEINTSEQKPWYR